jgi:2-keto-4-pentenoate hydratase/2-oxohepta-3-ene-1,7-dioic acid hydratase in catechol pathway
MWRPAESTSFDYEGELAVIIGSGGWKIPKDKALEHVAGYSCYNDGSVRDWQRHTSQFTPGKNFRHTGPFGPWLVTTDEIPDPSTLTLTTRLNGEVMQHATTDLLIFTIPVLINYISRFTRLEPGDVIVSGTPGGVGFKRDPQVFMKPGDVVEVEISKIGILKNPIEAESVD